MTLQHPRSNHNTVEWVNDDHDTHLGHMFPYHCRPSDRSDCCTKRITPTTWSCTHAHAWQVFWYADSPALALGMTYDLDTGNISWPSPSPPGGIFWTNWTINVVATNQFGTMAISITLLVRPAYSAYVQITPPLPGGAAAPGSQMLLQGQVAALAPGASAVGRVVVVAVRENATGLVQVVHATSGVDGSFATSYNVPKAARGWVAGRGEWRPWWPPARP